MSSILSEFVSRDTRRYKFQLGTVVASSLTGFLSGAIFASIIWYTAFSLLTR